MRNSVRNIIRIWLAMYVHNDLYRQPFYLVENGFGRYFRLVNGALEKVPRTA